MDGVWIGMGFVGSFFPNPSSTILTKPSPPLTLQPNNRSTSETAPYHPFHHLGIACRPWVSWGGEGEGEWKGILINTTPYHPTFLPITLLHLHATTPYPHTILPHDASGGRGRGRRKDGMGVVEGWKERGGRCLSTDRL